MKILIVTDVPFPDGFAPGNRIKSYAKGFLENNIETEVLCLKANRFGAESNEKDIVKGFYEGIKFTYTPGTSKKGKSFTKRRWLELKGLYNSIFYMSKIRNSGCIILVSNSIIYFLIFGVFSKLYGIKFILEKSEYPFVLKLKSKIGKIYAGIYVNNVYKIFDGILVESERLYKFFENKIRRNARLLLVPPTIDSSDFFIIPSIKIKNDYIFYCGTLSRVKKDGLDILIKAFKKVIEKYPDLKLKIAGHGLVEELKFFKDLVTELQLNDKVDFLGTLPRDEMIGYMKGAKILALAKELDEFMSGGYSSKVVEYLYTGNPTVITDLGPTTNIYKDKETIFFAKPNDVNSFADTILYVLNNYEEAKVVGQRGQKFALQYFSYKYHANRIIEWIKAFN